MRITAAKRFGRDGWMLENGKLALFLMAGGGHLAGLYLKERASVNPYWIPAWKTVEPGAYHACDAKRLGVKLLACIAGHNLCLGAFGGPSPEEGRAGQVCHGEAPVTRWRTLKRDVRKDRLVFKYGCRLPVAQMDFSRTVLMDADSCVIRIREDIVNLARRDTPFTMCQHVSFGPPFVEPGVTVFDIAATKGHTFPKKFGQPQRLKEDTPFAWPLAPGLKGKPVDLRLVGRERYGDFTTNLMDPKREQVWFSAVHPRLGLLVAYIWRRADFPWLGMWEENRARKTPPWNGKSLARGMEFSNTPFPLGLRGAVDLGRFQGLPTFRWLPARSRLTFEYAILAAAVEKGCRGVADIRPQGRTFSLDLAY